MITVGEIRETTKGMSDAAEMNLEVVPDGESWRLQMVFTDTRYAAPPSRPAAPSREFWPARSPQRPPGADYNAHALIPDLPPSVLDPRD